MACSRCSSTRRPAASRALEYAAALGCPHLHVMAGLVPEGNTRPSLRRRYVENLAFAAERAGAAGVTVLIGPITTRDIPGYLPTRQDDATSPTPAS